MKTPDCLYLHLTFPGSTFPHGLYRPEDHISQHVALMHFSNGSMAITPDRLDEIIYIAGLHGWIVKTRRPSANVPE